MRGLRSSYMEVKGVVVVEDAHACSDPRGSTRIGALEHVANRPIVRHVLDLLASAGVDDIVVAASVAVAAEVRQSLAAQERSGLRMQIVAQEAAPVDIVAGIKLAAPLVGRAPCIVHLASGLLAEPLGPLVDHLREAGPDLLLIVHQGLNPDEHLSPATQDMLHLAELDPERAALGMAGVCLFGTDALRRASAAPWRLGIDLDLTEVADGIAAGGGTLRVLPVSVWRKYAGDPLDLLELNRIALDRLDAEPHRPSNTGNRIEGRVWIHDRASISASVIVGPVVIGAGARIADAYIGPYTSIGADARIEGAEIEQSIVAAGASITHVGGRLVASVVGRDARIFRDFSLPRALRLRVGDGTVVGLC